LVPRAADGSGRARSSLGRWAAGTELTEALTPTFGRIDHFLLSEDAAIWGNTVTDERYAVVAQDVARL
jgi:hypothetical protein